MFLKDVTYQTNIVTCQLNQARIALCNMHTGAITFTVPITKVLQNAIFRVSLNHYQQPYNTYQYFSYCRFGWAKFWFGGGALPPLVGALETTLNCFLS